MSGRFTVLPDELDDAASRMRRLVDDSSTSLTSSVAEVGHDAFAEAMTTFASRWTTGLRLAREEVEAGATALAQSAALYRDGDAAADEHLAGK